MKTRDAALGTIQATPGDNRGAGANDWFAFLMQAGISALLGFAITALPLAMLSMFRPLPVSIGTLIGTGSLLLIWRPKVRWGSPEGAAAYVLVLVLALASVAFNAKFASQHVLTARDPGVYVATGRWLANEGTLLVDVRQGAFRDDPSLSFRSAGQYDVRPDGKLYFQFLHLLPAFLGAGAWIGGSWLLFKVNAILGGVALLMFFAFVSKLTRPWIALAATAALAVNLVQVHHSRDAYSEILSQAFLFGGLWVLWTARDRLDLRSAFVAGLLLGALCMTRIDAFILLAPMLAYIFYELVSANSPNESQPRLRRNFALALAFGIAVTATIGWLDARLLSPGYVADLGSRVRSMFALVGLTMAAGVVVLLLRRPLQAPFAWLYARRKALGTVAMVLILAIGAYALLLRPIVEYRTQRPIGLVEALQEREGVAVDATRSYAEESMVRLSWYLGLPALGAGIVGWAWLTNRAVRGRASRAWPLLLIFSAGSLLYLWKPSITPDHIWAMRRFLPVTIPVLIALAFWVVDTLIAEVKGAARYLSFGLALGIVALAIVFPVTTLIPVAGASTQQGMLEATEQVCEAIGDDGAVVLFKGGYFDLTFPQTVRSFCRVPAAVLPEGEPNLESVRALAHAWSEQGRRLYALSFSPTPFPEGTAESTRTKLVTARDFFYLMRTIEKRPAEMEKDHFVIYITEL